MRTTLRLSVLCLLTSATSALATEPAEFTDAMGKAVIGVALADAYMRACDEASPETQQQRQEAMSSWAARVDRAGYDRFMDSAAGLLSQAFATLDPLRDKLQTAAIEDVGRNRAICGTLGTKLSEDIFDVSRPVQFLLSTAGEFGINVADASGATALPNDARQLWSIATLSAQLLKRMDAAASPADAATDRKLRKAREEAAEAWLTTYTTLSVLGRVTGEDELREVRGDQQSRFAVKCRSFDSDDDEARLKTYRGQDTVVAGEPRTVSEKSDGDFVTLRDCKVFRYDPKSYALANFGDDAAGWTQSPLNDAEAYAGPNKGISAANVDRVLYAASFETLLDGLGNGYVDRDEAIYVLLRDGTAYQHARVFPFTDLDLARSRQREPDRWFTWSDDWGKVTLKSRTGDTLELGDARRLLPVPTGRTFSQTYDYRDVGAGGGTTDRAYAFAADGTLTYTSGGFVAGSAGGQYIATSRDEASVTARYRFDGYALIIDGPNGEERHFAALIDGNDARSPKELIIDGAVHWLRKAGK